MAVRTEMRRGKRRLIIDIWYRKQDGTLGRYRKDAEVQTLAAAREEERRRIAALAAVGCPEEQKEWKVEPPAPEPQSAPPASERRPKAASGPLFKDVGEDYLRVFAPSLPLASCSAPGHTSRRKLLHAELAIRGSDARVLGFSPDDAEVAASDG